MPNRFIRIILPTLGMAPSSKSLQQLCIRHFNANDMVQRTLTLLQQTIQRLCLRYGARKTV
jgi:hypothetical protein